ncbi:hypothetical protein C8R21_101224 [Nitrosospira multiformis]|uniref:Uncharacterized protein n=1 Tax=Nitrosospira multiformis TaxID=1231 RepID=A0A2T5II77_9PROT|nr:hypothetical protein C8R21_101224 [Nitrosospira multiformis]
MLLLVKHGNSSESRNSPVGALAGRRRIHSSGIHQNLQQRVCRSQEIGDAFTFVIRNPPDVCILRADQYQCGLFDR